MREMTDFRLHLTRARRGRAPLRGARGFIHILFAVLAVLGLSMWGVSEWVFRTTDAEQEGEAEKSASLNAARRALMEYALTPPPRIQVENRTGRFSALAFREDGEEAAAPYRYFSLPCPDVGADGNWDGVSDFLYETDDAGLEAPVSLVSCGAESLGTDASGYQPNIRGSRTGRFPWRSFNGEIGGRFAYIRGAGDRDIVDDFGGRLWYVAARNMTREDRALNPHWQLRQEDGWLRLANLSEISDGIVCPGTECGTLDAALASEIDGRDFGRVAAVAVAPGVFGLHNEGARAPESLLMTGSVVMATVAHEAYLEETTYSDLVGTSAVDLPDHDAATSPLILYETAADDSSVDSISYFTIDDLTARSDELFSDEGGAIADLLEGRDGHLGIRRLMQAHLARYGYLPAPAAFGRRTAEQRQRVSGAPSAPITLSGGEVAEVQAAAVGGTGVTVTAFLPARSVERVYLQPGSQLAAADENFYGDGLPPYNLALYALDTALNVAPMSDAVRTDLMANDIYPHENLFGFRQPTETSRVAIDSPFVREVGNPLAPLDSRVYMRSPPPLREVSFLSPQRAATGGTLYMALAEPALAYLSTDDGLGGMIELADGDTQAPSESPSYGLQVKLPPGTRFAMIEEPTSPMSIFLPSRIEVSGAEYDTTSGRWTLREQLSQPAIVVDDSNRFITVTAVLNSLAADSANIGFLPAADGGARYLDTNFALSLGISLTVGNPISSLPGGDTPLEAAGGVRLPFNQAVSQLPTDLSLFTEGRLIITPFPPAGRPLAFEDIVAGVPGVFTPTSARVLAIPSVLFINYTGYDDNEQSREFVLPAGAQIYYPPNARLQLGEDFAFPVGTRALLPPGSVMTVEVLPGSNLPGGQPVTVNLPSVNDRTATLAVTMANGAMIELWGLSSLTVTVDASDPANPTTLTVYEEQGARIVLEDGFGIGSAQEMFDVELLTPYQIAGSVGGVFPGAAVLQPLTGRTSGDSIAPIEMRSDLMLRTHTWTQAQFLTRGRNLPMPGSLLTVAGEVEQPAAAVRDTDPVQPAETTTVTANLIPNLPLPGGEFVEITVRARVAETDGTDNFLISLRINEQTRFMIPPGERMVGSMFATAAVNTGLGARSLATTFTFPDGTAIYDPNIPSLNDLTVGADGVNGMAVLVGELQVETATTVDGGGAIVHQLVLLPDSDMRLAANIIPAGSVVDAVQGYAWPPGAIYTLPGVSPDLSATSERQMYLYFPSAITLTNRAAAIPTGQFVGPPPGDTVTADYSNAIDSILDDISPGGLNLLNAIIEDAPQIFTLRIATGGDWRLEDGIRYTQSQVLDELPLLDDDRLELPAGTFIVLPAGGTLNFLSANAMDSVSPEEADYVFLPPDAVAVPPPGAIIRVSTALGEQVLGSENMDESPPIIRLGGASGRGLALVAHSDLMETAPVVFYESDAYLFDSQAPSGERDDVVVRIAGGSRGDIFGNITRRDGRNFALDFLPSDTAEFLRNFPMVYAVAEECRIGATTEGEDCATAPGEGLHFTAFEDEVIVLQEEMIAGGGILVSVYSELDDNPVMGPTYGPIEDVFRYHARNRTQARAAESIYVSPDGAIVIMHADVGGNPFPPTALTLGDAVAATLFESGPADAELRVYMNVGSDPANLNLENAHYAVMQTVSLVAGGFSETDSGSLRIPLTMEFNSVAATSDLLLGFGAQVGGGIREQFPFGEGSYWERVLSTTQFGTVRIRLPLEKYSVMNPDDAFLMGVNPASRYANLDSAGEITFQTDVGERVVFSGAASQVVARNATVAIRPPPITLDTSTAIGMEQGYLWQGYINPKGADVSLSFSTAARLTTGEVLSDEIYMRVHPSDKLLNFWGSGLERAEGMDSRSIAGKPPASSRDWRPFVMQNATPTEAYYVVPVLQSGPPDMEGVLIPPLGTRRARYLENRLWRFGWRSPLVTVSGVPASRMFVNVRDAFTGEVVGRNVQSRWVSRSRPGLVSGPGARALEENRVIYGGPNSAPFAVPDQSYYSNNIEIWAHRRMIESNLLTPVAEDSLLEVEHNGVMLRPVFNMPAFQLIGRALRPPLGWEFDTKAADVRPIPLEPGEMNPCGVPNYARVPGVLLGGFSDTDRASCAIQVPGFSGRLRRDSVLSDDFEATRQTIALSNSNRVTTTVALDLVIDTIPRPQTRVALPSVLDDTPANAEVRAAFGNAPEEYNTALTGGLTPGLANPRSYTIPGDRIMSTIIAEQGTPSSVSMNDMRRQLGADVVAAPLASDMMFYLDRAYTPSGFAPADNNDEGIPTQGLSLGVNFRLSGPGAIVPHFGGRRADSTAEVYAARSRLFYGLFADDPDGTPDGTADDDDFKLHLRYSEANYECPVGSVLTSNQATCPAMQNPDNVPFWIPMISGVMAFEGVEGELTGPGVADADVMLVLPQPQAEVMDADGNMRTIHAGSIIHPREGLVIPSVPIPAASRLVVHGEAAAAVDVSPASSPIPIDHIRDGSVMHTWDMNLPPLREGNLIIEPLRFATEELVDFRIRAVNDASGLSLGGYAIPANFRSPRNCVLSRSQCRYYDYLFLGSLRGRDLIRLDTQFHAPVIFRLRYDGTLARGYLANERMADILTDYYSGEEIFTQEHLFTTYFPRRGYGGPFGQNQRAIRSKYGLQRNPAPDGANPDDYNAPIGQTAAQFGNPLSWHWINRTDKVSFIPMGGARQFAVLAEYPSVPGADREFGCGYLDPDKYPAAYPQYPYSHDSPIFSRLPCVGARDRREHDLITVEPDDEPQNNAVPHSYYWVGVLGDSSATAPNTMITVRNQPTELDEDEFLALRLPHLIQIPANSEMAIQPFDDDSEPPYPSEESRFFQFPPDSVANILQVDAASWESVHPYVSRYLPGAVLANDGGIYPPAALAASDNVREALQSTRILLSAAEQMEVQENNDGHRRIAVGGRRVMHYAKTENIPAQYSYSNTHVYTNVWIRLPSGGYLVDDATGEITNLPADTVVNPILGTYLPGDFAQPEAPPVRSNYQAFADLDPANPPLLISRPALIIPPGTTVRIGTAGARITNVKAAAIFSILPIDGVSCPHGDVNRLLPIDGLRRARTISQAREGVSENQFDENGDDGILFTIGHPCAWIDDFENADGDRFFVYRSRRRYTGSPGGIISSNDRTYLLGGRLQLS